MVFSVFTERASHGVDSVYQSTKSTTGPWVNGHLLAEGPVQQQSIVQSLRDGHPLFLRHEAQEDTLSPTPGWAQEDLCATVRQRGLSHAGGSQSSWWGERQVWKGRPWERAAKGKNTWGWGWGTTRMSNIRRLFAVSVKRNIMMISAKRQKWLGVCRSRPRRRKSVTAEFFKCLILVISAEVKGKT